MACLRPDGKVSLGSCHPAFDSGAGAKAALYRLQGSDPVIRLISVPLIP